MNLFSNHQGSPLKLRKKDLASIIYHNIFDYPLTSRQLTKWELESGVAKKILEKSDTLKVDYKNGLYFLKGKGGLVSKRAFREKNFFKKLKIAKKAAKIISFTPTIKGVFLTGALTMKNADEKSDIDLLVITKADFLWSTRLVVWLSLKIFGIDIRKPKESSQKDKICLNMWLDENHLKWKKENRNVFTAHEISQAFPLVDKDYAFQRFIYSNLWIQKFWPKATTQIKYQFDEIKKKEVSHFSHALVFFEKIARKVQYRYMKNKITNEKIGKGYAFFHPVDWGEIVLSKLGLKIPLDK
jgi:predicted nucleotidyltransferase